MSDENRTPEEPQTRRPVGPTHSTRAWRACCLVPTLAVFAILVFAVLASLNSTIDRTARKKATTATPQTRQEFMQFGRQYIGIAKGADGPSRDAFRILMAMRAGDASTENMHTAFKKASDANGRASEAFGSLDVPDGLVSRDLLISSARSMSKSYAARKRACDVLAAWNGDPNDKNTIRKYEREAKAIQTNADEGLRNFIQGATDNGLSENDMKDLVQAQESMGLPKIGAWKWF